MLLPELPFALERRGGCAGVLTHPDDRLRGLGFDALVAVQAAFLPSNIPSVDYLLALLLSAASVSQESTPSVSSSGRRVPRDSRCRSSTRASCALREPSC